MHATVIIERAITNADIFRRRERIFEKHKYVEDMINGYKLRYVVSGQANARTIIFMQGLEIQQMFMRYVKAFEDEYRILLISD